MSFGHLSEPWRSWLFGRLFFLKGRTWSILSMQGQNRNRNGSRLLLGDWRAMSVRFWWDCFVTLTNYLLLVVYYGRTDSGLSLGTEQNWSGDSVAGSVKCSSQFLAPLQASLYILLDSVEMPPFQDLYQVSCFSVCFPTETSQLASFLVLSWHSKMYQSDE